MSKHERQLKVFLCYAKSDKSKVQGLYRNLRKRGVSVWFSGIDLLPGQDIRIEIPKAIDDSDAIIICFTKNSVDKEGYIQTEIKLAIDKSLEMPEGRIFLIPACLEDCELPYSLKRYKAVNLYEKEGFPQLMKALELRASQLELVLGVEGFSTSIKGELEAKKVVKQKNKNTDSSKGSASNVVSENISDNLIVSGDRNVINIGTPSSTNSDSEKKPFSFLKWLFDPKSISIIIALIVMIFGNNIYEQRTGRSFFAPPVVFTETIIPSNDLTGVPINTALVVTVVPTDLQSEIKDSKGVSMILVPAGEFIMGSDNNQEDEKFSHKLSLDSFYIDKYEVTNSFYRMCVDDGSCSEPHSERSYTRTSYYNDPDFGLFPVIYVDWNMAVNFCKWRDARLPYESEWEKAARGVDGKIFPWGDTINRTNSNYLGSDTLPVGSYEVGKSNYGLYDMAGNVWEWTGSIYKSYPYVRFDGREDLSPALGARVFRGGSWGDVANDVRSSIRIGADPIFFGYDIGFRCAKDAP